MKPLSIGIDIGTTHTKAVILSVDGQVMAQFKIAYEAIQAQPGYHELDANVVFEAVIGVLKKCFARESTSEIIAVCFSAAMHGLMAVEEDGKPLTGVMTWADTRSRYESLELKGSVIAEELYLATGTPIHPMSPLSKLIWLKAKEPGIFKKAAKFISFKEYVFFKLTGQYIIDHSIASATGLFDIHEFSWSKLALITAGINEGHLSAICPIDHILSISPHYQEMLGIGKNVSFIVGGSDGAMANIGSNAIKSGIASLTIGTSAAIRTVSARPVLDKKQRLFCYAVEHNIYICGGPLNNGGAIAKWFSEKVLHKNLGSDKEYGDFVKGAFENNRPSGLIFVPYLMGERAIHWDPFAKAAFIGLNASHTDESMLLSIFEGISFALYEILQAMEESGMPVTKVVAGGGFTASPAWLQLVSDIFNKEITVLDDADVSAKGSAIFGFRATGVIKDYAEIPAGNVAVVTYQPDKKRNEVYRHFFEIFTSLYPLLQDSFFQLDRLQENK